MTELCLIELETQRSKDTSLGFAMNVSEKKGYLNQNFHMSGLENEIQRIIPHTFNEKSKHSL